ncbi:Mss4-like protein [Whalleya microplaca]|nr:Mss4-like protein [Whalleya microplaca]
MSSVDSLESRWLKVLQATSSTWYMRNAPRCRHKCGSKLLGIRNIQQTSRNLPIINLRFNMASNENTPLIKGSLIKGSCLCGSVEYTLANGYGRMALCHCQNCRKISGSPFAAGSVCKVENFNIVAGQGDVALYEDKNPRDGTRIKRCFCRRCGSALYNLQDKSPRIVIVYMGTMDGVQGEGVPPEAAWTPQEERWYKHKAGWLHCSANTVKKDER